MLFLLINEILIIRLYASFDMGKLSSNLPGSREWSVEWVPVPSDRLVTQKQ